MAQCRKTQGTTGLPQIEVDTQGGECCKFHLSHPLARLRFNLLNKQISLSSRHPTKGGGGEGGCGQNKVQKKPISLPCTSNNVPRSTHTPTHLANYLPPFQALLYLTTPPTSPPWFYPPFQPSNNGKVLSITLQKAS